MKRSRPWKTALKPVIQLDRTGCGIASVAAIAGLSYPQAKAIAGKLGICVSDPQLWSSTKHVRRMLRYCGVRLGAREVPFRSWSALPDLALLSIKWHLESDVPCWHWVVFVRQYGVAGVLDPKRSLRNHRRMDFGRIKPKWYIPVSGR